MLSKCLVIDLLKSRLPTCNAYLPRTVVVQMIWRRGCVIINYPLLALSYANTHVFDNFIIHDDASDDQLHRLPGSNLNVVLIVTSKGRVPEPKSFLPSVT